jgi:hypothetical protein
VAALILLAVLDAAFAGFRASVGRTGLVRHARADLIGAGRGLACAVLLLTPSLLGFLVDLVGGASLRTDYLPAGRAMSAVFLPYAAVMLLAVLGYLVLDWRRRFLAAAVILGPGTLVRPAVAIAGAVAAVLAGHRGSVRIEAAAAVLALLLVEPLIGRFWYSDAAYAHRP